MSSSITGAPGLLCAVLLTFACGHDRSVERIVISPDHARQAILYMDMGGGAAGWCYHRLSLQSTSDSTIDLSTFNRPGEFLFQASCSSEIGVVWQGPRAIHITYTMGEYGNTVYMSPTADSGRIRLTYERVHN